MFSRKDLRRLLVPLMIEQALAMTIGMADTVMVASCSEAAVSGVSLIDSVNAVFLWLFPALATGGGVVLAQYIGRGEEENARRSVGQLCLLLVGFSLMISVLFMLFRDELLVLLFGQIEPQVMAYARTYFTISIISYPFLALYNVGASVFRAVGNSKLSMTVSTAANILNLIGNAILIYGFGLEVLGAGLATLASRILGAVIMMYKLLRFYFCIVVTLYPLAFTITPCLRAAGDVRFCLIGAMTGMWLGRILCSHLFVSFGWDIMGVWIAIVADWLIRIAFYLPRYLSGRWLKKKVI